MNREEFLQGLQEALSGEVPPEVVRDNLKYYDDYIRSGHQAGRPEREILDELGEPRLIARTIIDTTPGAGNGGFAEYRGGIFGSGSHMGDSRSAETYTEDANIHYYDLNKWYWKVLGVVIVIAIITLVIAIIGGILTLVIPMLPVLALVVIVMWFVRGPRG